jgi:hypothetical protein
MPLRFIAFNDRNCFETVEIIPYKWSISTPMHVPKGIQMLLWVWHDFVNEGVKEAVELDGL